MSVETANSLVEIIKTPEDFQALAFSAQELFKRSQKFCERYNGWVPISKDLFNFGFDPLDILDDARLKLKSYSNSVRSERFEILIFGSYPFINIIPSESDLRFEDPTNMPIRATSLWYDLPRNVCSRRFMIKSRQYKAWFHFEDIMYNLEIAAKVLFEGFKKYELENGACLYFSPNVEKMGRTDLAEKIVSQICGEIK